MEWFVLEANVSAVIVYIYYTFITIEQVDDSQAWYLLPSTLIVSLFSFVWFPWLKNILQGANEFQWLSRLIVIL